jgi:hypothetical protein
MPRGAQRVSMLSITLRADCSSDVPVEELHLARTGLGFNADIVAVYAELGGRRVSQATAPDRRGALTLRLENFSVPACESKTLLILMDVSSTAEVAGEHRLGIATVDSVVAPSASIVLKPLLPRGMSPVRTAAESAGTVSVEYLRLLKRVSYGMNKTVLRLRLSASGERDLQVLRIVLTNEGSARDSDLQNIALYDNRGRRISSSALRMHDDRVDLSLESPLDLARNASKVIELHADTLASRRKTIRFVIDEPGDIRVEEVRRSR